MRESDRIRTALVRALMLPCVLGVSACPAASDEPAGPPPAPTLTALAMTPVTANLATGATQQFAFTSTWSDGSSTAASVQFSATGGSISATGLYTAGAVPGTYTVIVRHVASGLADTSAVTLTAPVATLTGIALTPATAALNTGASQQFALSATWSDGSTTVPPVEYTATGGTVTAGGLYTAGGAAGTFRVIARHIATGLADTSNITLTAAPPTLNAISLTPASVSVNTGATQQFSLSATWSDGSSTVPPVEYSATGGSISGSGLYTAGATPGAFRAIARHVSSGRADTSTITVTSPGSSLVNECATPQPGWIWCDDFDVNRLASYFEFETDGGSFARVNGVGNSGSFGMRARWGTVGQVSAGALHLAIGKTPQTYFDPVDAGTAQYRDLYWRLYVRNQPGWTGGGGDKLSRALVFASSSTWATAAVAPVWSGQGTNSNVLSIDPSSGTDAAGVLRSTTYNDFANTRYLGQVFGPTPVFATANTGTWYCVEAHARLNDAGSSNGLFEFWVNGNLEGQRANMNWIGAFSGYAFNAVFVENYWNAGSPAVQERYIDNFVVSTQRIGC